MSLDAQAPRVDPVAERDMTIAERIAWIEHVLKYQPPLLVPYRRQMERELFALTTDPEERYGQHR